MKIAIVGTCPSSRMLAPFGDKSWDVWACGPDNVDKLPRVTAWFELHGDLDWPGYSPSWERRYIDWLNLQPFDLYAQRLDLFPRALEFPSEILVSQFGSYWFTSSVAWMLAYAITCKPDEIGLWGCDMAQQAEYRLQRPGAIRMVEHAQEAGIHVFVPPESDLLRPPPLYGYSIATERGRKLAVRERELLDRVAETRARRERLVHELNHEVDHLVGALDQLDYDTTVWGSDVVAPTPVSRKRTT